MKKVCDHCGHMHGNDDSSSAEAGGSSSRQALAEKVVCRREQCDVSNSSEVGNDVVVQGSLNSGKATRPRDEESSVESARNRMNKSVNEDDKKEEKRQCVNDLNTEDTNDSQNISKQGTPANFCNNQVLIKKIHPKTDFYKIFSKEVSKNPLGWQAEKRTVKDRFEFLFCNEVLADVFFYVGSEEEKQKIPAHTFVLSIGSAVFDAMFNSHADDRQNEAFEVHISDVEPPIFVSLLRFLYTDEVNVGPESVMSTLYIAKKYGVPAMENTCLTFLKENLETDNAFLLLSQARLFDETDLEKMCLDVIDRETYDTIRNDGFLEIDHVTLCEFLQRDTLRIKEAELFKAVLRWANAECQRKTLQQTSENYRIVLGDALFLIRFPLMTVEEFANVAAQPGLLDDRDIVAQFLQYHKNPKPPSKFVNRPRSAASGRELRIHRFTKTEARWGYSGHADKINVADSHQYNVTLELIQSEDGKSVARNETSYTSDGTDEVFPVYFRTPMRIEADTFYTASVVVQGPDTYYGTKGRRKVVYALNDKTDVTFIFSLSGNNNGTCVDDGQIPEILFSTQIT
ncbi:unnamed protein product [Auanema sp. JU1783]|nr:unnamed protein product [Auanema sp. JU1783]